ncbi:MAG TPA: hypothetical protein VGB37_13055, partial [Candidatus Lokiarchaeia archaeon]
MDIPIIEPEKGGYWEVYPDRKIWHVEEGPEIMKFKDYKEIAKKYGVGKDWLTLEQGDNKVRIVSTFEDYGNHYNPATKKSIICIGKDEGCVACAKGLKPNVQFLGWAIDRKDNKVKLLRIGYTVFQMLGDYQKSEDYGFEDIPSYDIT